MLSLVFQSGFCPVFQFGKRETLAIVGRPNRPFRHIFPFAFPIRKAADRSTAGLMLNISSGEEEPCHEGWLAGKTD